MKRLSQSLRALICFVCLVIIFTVSALADGVTHYTYDSAGNNYECDIVRTYPRIMKQIK